MLYNTVVSYKILPKFELNNFDELSLFSSGALAKFGSTWHVRGRSWLMFMHHVFTPVSANFFVTRFVFSVSLALRCSARFFTTSLILKF